MKQRLLHLCLYLTLSAVLLTLTACSPVATPPKYYYNLTATTPVMHTVNPTAHVLLVTPSSVESPYNTNKIAYTEQTSPYQISYFGEHYWASTPDKLLTPNITNAMINTDHFKAVANPPYGGTADYRVDTDLVTLVQQFNGTSSQVTLSLRAVIVNAQNDQILRSQRFTVTKAASVNNPQAGVIAANQALAEILSQLQVWVVGQTR